MTNALDVDASGVVVGSSTDATGVTTGFSWKDGVFTFYPSTFGGAQSEVRGINDAAMMVGDAEYAPYATYATLWTPDGKATNLGTLPGAVGSYAKSITPGGLVVGGCEFPNVEYHVCTWQDGGAAVDLGVPPDTGDINGFANGVNASGGVVGSTGPGLGQQHAVVWKDGQAIDLQTVSTLSAGMVLGFASAIADDGTILASGEIDGAWYQLLLTPHD